MLFNINWQDNQMYQIANEHTSHVSLSSFFKEIDRVNW